MTSRLLEMAPEHFFAKSEPISSWCYRKNLFWRKTGKSKFPRKPKQQEYAFLKSMKSLRV